MSLFQLIKSISKKEWQVIALVWVIITLLWLLPIIIAQATISPDKVISGILYINPYDYPVYFSYLEQIVQGNWLVANLYTTEPSLPMLRLFWILTALPSWLFGWPVVISFFFAKIIWSVIFLSVLYIFLKYFFISVIKTRLIFLITTFSGGLGFWFLLPIELYLRFFHKIYIKMPIDLGIPEAFPILSLLSSPHLLMSWSLLLLIFLSWLILVESQKSKIIRLKLAGGMGLAGAWLFLDHPFHILPVYLVIGFHFLYLFFKDKKYFEELIWPFLIFVLISSLGVGWHIYSILQDPMLAVKALQNNIITPSINMVLAGFGILFITALVELYYRFIRQKNYNTDTIFLFIWLIVSFLLIYSPVLWQRRMIQGLFVPICILAGFWLFRFFEKNKNQLFFKKILFLYAVAFLLLPTTIYNFGRHIYLYSQPQIKGNFYYYNKDLYLGIKALTDLTDSDSVILSHKRIGNFIPALTLRHVYLGHSIETAYFWPKEYSTKTFFQGMADEKAKNWLQQSGITHIFYSSYEKELGDFDPRSKDYLELVWQNNEVQIYKVIPDLLR